MPAVITGRGASVARRPRSSSALTAKLTAFSANAQPNPAAAARNPATGASRIWASTAADQMPELAATSSSSPTRVGSRELAAALKNTDPADRPKATT